MDGWVGGIFEMFQRRREVCAFYAVAGGKRIYVKPRREQR